METDPPTFTLNGITYRISSHIWRNHPTRVGQVTVELIRDTIGQPDFQEMESRDVTLYWKWFPEIGSRHYMKVVVKAGAEIYLVITAHLDRNFRREEEAR